MTVLIPGFFTALEDVHISALDQIRGVVPDDARLEILIFPKPGYDPEGTKNLLLSLKQVAGVHVAPDNFVLNDAFLDEHSISCVVEFTPNVFESSISWPRASRFEPPHCVIELSIEHPDFVAATRLFKIRRSPRHFKPTPVSEEILTAALEAARHSPSAGNLQPYSIILVRNKQVMKALSDASHHQEIVAKCPGLFVFVEERERSSVKYRERGATFYALVDTTIACSHLQLALEAVGVQSRWIGAYKDDEVDAILGLKGKRVIGILLYGYGEKRQTPSGRRDLYEYVTQID